MLLELHQSARGRESWVIYAVWHRSSSLGAERKARQSPITLTGVGAEEMDEATAIGREVRGGTTRIVFNFRVVFAQQQSLWCRFETILLQQRTSDARDRSERIQSGRHCKR